MMDRKAKAIAVITVLKKVVSHLSPPMSEQLAQKYQRDPYIILISCLLSLRARDVVTQPVSEKLFAHASTPEAMITMNIKDIEKIIHPIGFYRKKAHVVQAVSRELLERYKGKVPQDESELLSLPGVGRKTANLVRAVAFGIPAICVDTHVHKLSNQLGLVTTKKPYETERALEKLLPRKYWNDVNNVLVTLGQQTRTVCERIPDKDRSLFNVVCGLPQRGKERVKNIRAK